MEAQEQKRGGETVDRKQDILMLLKPVLFLPSPLNEDGLESNPGSSLQTEEEAGLP